MILHFRKPHSLFNRLLKIAHHIKSLFRNVIAFSFEQRLKPFNCLFNVHKLSFLSRERLRHKKRLCQKPLYFPCSRNNQLILFGQLLYSKNGNYILQIFVVLKYFLNSCCNLVMSFSNNIWVEHFGWRLQGINRWINSLLCQTSRQNSSGVQVSKSCCRRWICEIVCRNIHSLNACDRTLLCTGYSLLKLTQFGWERWLVTHCRRNSS